MVFTQTLSTSYGTPFYGDTTYGYYPLYTNYSSYDDRAREKRYHEALADLRRALMRWKECSHRYIPAELSIVAYEPEVRVRLSLCTRKEPWSIARVGGVRSRRSRRRRLRVWER